MDYQELKAKHQERYNQILSDCGVFWAFSNGQFKEGLAKTKLEKGDKIVSIGMGGFMPLSQNARMEKELKQADKEHKQALKELKEMKESAILYELWNFEAFHTGDREDVYNAFRGIYTPKEIDKVYFANLQNA